MRGDFTSVCCVNVMKDIEEGGSLRPAEGIRVVVVAESACHVCGLVGVVADLS
jgi:hypothetical protein